MYYDAYMRILYVEFSGMKLYIFRGLKFFCLANLRLNRCSCFGGFLRILAYFCGAVQEKVFGGLGFHEMIPVADLGFNKYQFQALGSWQYESGRVEVREVFSVNGWNTSGLVATNFWVFVLNWGCFDIPANCQKKSAVYYTYWYNILRILYQKGMSPCIRILYQ